MGFCLLLQSQEPVHHCPHPGGIAVTRQRAAVWSHLQQLPGQPRKSLCCLFWLLPLGSVSDAKVETASPLLILYSVCVYFSPAYLVLFVFPLALFIWYWVCLPLYPGYLVFSLFFLLPCLIGVKLSLFLPLPCFFGVQFSFLLTLLILCSVYFPPYPAFLVFSLFFLLPCLFCVEFFTLPSLLGVQFVSHLTGLVWCWCRVWFPAYPAYLFILFLPLPCLFGVRFISPFTMLIWCSFMWK